MTPGLGPLFDSRNPHRTGALRTPAATADPQTSHDAADRLRASGAEASRVRQVVQALADYRGPAPTSRELAGSCGMDRHDVAKRLSDAREMALVAQGEPRTCRESGRQALTWHLSAHGRAWLQSERGRT